MLQAGQPQAHVTWHDVMIPMFLSAHIIYYTIEDQKLYYLGEHLDIDIIFFIYNRLLEVGTLPGDNVQVQIIYLYRWYMNLLAEPKRDCLFVYSTMISIETKNK